MQEREIVIEYDEQQKRLHEEGVEIPLERINLDTLRNLISEFVTREWEELGDAGFTLDDKMEQVHRQLKEHKAKVVFDLSSNTANIVVSR
jgi:uncharacterized protein